MEAGVVDYKGKTEEERDEESNKTKTMMSFSPSDLLPLPCPQPSCFVLLNSLSTSNLPSPPSTSATHPLTLLRSVKSN